MAADVVVVPDTHDGSIFLIHKFNYKTLRHYCRVIQGGPSQRGFDGSVEKIVF